MKSLPAARAERLLSDQLADLRRSAGADGDAPIADLPALDGAGRSSRTPSCRSPREQHPHALFGRWPPDNRDNSYDIPRHTAATGDHDPTRMLKKGVAAIITMLKAAGLILTIHQFSAMIG